MNKFTRILIFAIIAVLLLSVCGCKKVSTTTLSTSLPTGPQSSNLVVGDINVKAETNQDYAFIVEKNMKDVSISGSFETFGGLPNSIDIVIMDDATYNAWIKGKSLPLLFHSGSMSIGEINQAIPAAGKYHITFSNTFPASTAPGQQVKVNISLKWTY